MGIMGIMDVCKDNNRAHSKLLRVHRYTTPSASVTFLGVHPHRDGPYCVHRYPSPSAHDTCLCVHPHRDGPYCVHRDAYCVQRDAYCVHKGNLTIIPQSVPFLERQLVSGSHIWFRELDMNIPEINLCFSEIISMRKKIWFPEIDLSFQEIISMRKKNLVSW
jgi:hypothetical protein